MARRARFGIAVRSQQNIAGTLLAIAREMQGREDSNIMDAWKNGGEVHGHKVTDQMVLDYWNKREQTLDQKDPAYDTIKSNIMQLHYGIEQSKMDLLHVQGKINDRQYAQFFLKWAAKVPRQGEFWRVLQKDAATLMERSKASLAAAADKAKLDAFNKFTAAREGDLGLGNALTDAIQSLSNETGLNITANGDRLLELLSSDYAANPGKYHALTDAIKSSGAGFNGVFTPAWVATQVSAAESAYGDIATRAHKDGYSTAYDQATKGQASMTSWGSSMGAWPVSKAYDAAYRAFDKVWSDPHASFREKNAAAATFAGIAGNLAQTKGLPTAVVTMLQADAQRALGQDAGDSPSFGAVSGHPGITPEIGAQVATTNAAEDAMKMNPGMYSYAPLKSDGTFDTTGQGPIGVIANTAIPSDAVFVAVPGMDGKPSMVAVQPKQVMVKDPNDPNAAPIPVGAVITYSYGGNTVTMYGVRNGSGQQGWLTRNPYADGVTGQSDKDGNLILTLPGQNDPTATAQQIEKQYPGIDVQSAVNYAMQHGGSATATGYADDGKGNKQKVTITFDGGKFSVTNTAQVYDPQTGKTTDGFATTTPYQVADPATLRQETISASVWNGNASSIPGYYSSPASASVAVADTNMSSAQVAALAKDPNFQHAFINQTMQTLGTTNPADQRVVDAWHAATDKSLGLGMNFGDPLANGMTVSPTFAGTRNDLTYPGVETAKPNESTAQITFGGQTLKVPNVPAYLLNSSAATPAANLQGSVLGNIPAQFMSSVLQPGQMPGVPAAPGSGITAGSGITQTPVATSGAPTLPSVPTAPSAPTIPTSNAGPSSVVRPGTGPVAY